jgi:alkylation response protein AidB-like acyl-CoA dehydrogenase
MSDRDGSVSDLRRELERWLDEHWDPEQSLLAWRTLLVRSGWGCSTWPAAWGGRGLSSSDGDVVTSTLANYGVPGVTDGVGMHLATPTLLEHGSDDLKSRLLQPTATGAVVWCQLFSEPGAGSDLAGLTTKAERDDDEWVVTGQKVWNTGAAHADLGLLLARTDWTVPKHQGISYFVLPMKQDVITVRPLRQMNGHSSFNEVFLDNARVPGDNLVGDAGRGWAAALTTLAHERRLAASKRPPIPRDRDGRCWHEAVAEQRAASEPHKWYPQRAGRVDLLVEQASAMNRSSDPVVRQAVAQVHARALTARWTAQRAAAARGRPPGPDGSLGKLMSSDIARAASAAHTSIAGSSGMIDGTQSPAHGVVAEIFVSVPGQSIAGGTDEIQHNIIGERILGLPKEPYGDVDRPFREIRSNAP